MQKGWLNRRRVQFSGQKGFKTHFAHRGKLLASSFCGEEDELDRRVHLLINFNFHLSLSLNFCLLRHYPPYYCTTEPSTLTVLIRSRKLIPFYHRRRCRCKKNNGWGIKTRATKLRSWHDSILSLYFLYVLLLYYVYLGDTRKVDEKAVKTFQCFQSIRFHNLWHHALS